VRLAFIKLSEFDADFESIKKLRKNSYKKTFQHKIEGIMLFSHFIVEQFTKFLAFQTL
jgi:hypothetical protein